MYKKKFVLEMNIKNEEIVHLSKMRIMTYMYNKSLIDFVARCEYVIKYSRTHSDPL